MPLDEIGGIAVGDGDEDGYCSGCTGEVIPQRICAFRRRRAGDGKPVGAYRQRIAGRVGHGANFRLDNPRLQRLKTGAAAVLPQRDVPFCPAFRARFLTAPLAFLLLHAYISFMRSGDCALFVIPHMVHASLTNSKIQAYRHSSGGNLAKRYWHGISHRRPLVALINRTKGNLTSRRKGGLVKQKYVDLG